MSAHAAEGIAVMQMRPRRAEVKASERIGTKQGGTAGRLPLNPARTTRAKAPQPDHDRMAENQTDTIIARCEAKGLRMTDQRRTIATVLEGSDDHPDVEELYARASAIDPRISIATIYRTVKLFEEAGILDKLEFGDGRARYEDGAREHHDHLIDMQTGEVIEFYDPEIEALQEKIAQRLGYRLKGHKLELYGVPLAKRAEKT